MDRRLIAAALLCGCAPRQARDPAPAPVAAVVAPTAPGPVDPGADPSPQVQTAPTRAAPDPIPVLGEVPAHLDADALDMLLARAAQSESDALVVWVDGAPVVSWARGGEQVPLDTMALSTAVVGLAVLVAADEHDLDLNAPVGTWVDAWGTGPHAAITLDQVLTHTSGLAQPADTGPIFESGDFMAFAVDSPVATPPGTVWAYNPNAVAVLPAIVEAATGLRLDLYLADRLFAPMGITTWAWALDEANHPQALAGLQARADDLAALGLLLAQRGVWHGRRLVPAALVDRLTAPTDLNPQASRLWRIAQHTRSCVIDDAVLDAWSSAGVDPDFIAALAPLAHRDLGDAFLDEVTAALGGGPEARARWEATTWRQGLPDCTPDRVDVGFYASGYLGQYLVVLPEAGVVAVRQADWRTERDDPDTYADFVDRVMALAGYD